MVSSALKTIIQQIEKLTLDEQIFLSKHLDNLAHQQNTSDIVSSRLKIIQSYRVEILQLGSSYGASNIRIFSLDREEGGTSNHEINFLVNLEENRSLFDLGGLLIDLRKLLGFETFVFTEETLKDNYRDKILQNAIAL